LRKSQPRIKLTRALRAIQLMRGNHNRCSKLLAPACKFALLPKQSRHKLRRLPQKMSDYLGVLLIWTLPAMTLLFVPSTFGHRLTTAFVVLGVQIPVRMFFLLVLATVFKFLRGFGK
jgi:hypothetical protein